jgi:hypothetical protein
MLKGKCEKFIRKMHYVGLSIVLMMGKMLRGKSSNHEMYILLEEFEVSFEQDAIVDI